MDIEEMMMEWILAAVLGGLAVGLHLGSCMEARIWRLKADPDFRTAMCSGGKFYYVIPEKEYVERNLP